MSGFCLWPSMWCSKLVQGLRRPCRQRCLHTSPTTVARVSRPVKRVLPPPLIVKNVIAMRRPGSRGPGYFALFRRSLAVSYTNTTLLTAPSCRSFHSSFQFGWPGEDSESDTAATNVTATTTATGGLSDSDNVDKLIERTQSFLQSDKGKSSENIEPWLELLHDWNRATRNVQVSLTENETTGTIDALYGAWAKPQSFPPRDYGATIGQLAESQAPLLPLWLEIYANLGKGPRALQVMQGWSDCFESHMELRPTRSGYESVLRAYAKGSAAMVHPSNLDHRDDNLLEEGSIAAVEIITLLDDFSFTMKPVETTILLALQCVALHPGGPGVFEKVLQRAESLVFDDKGHRRMSAQSDLWLDSFAAVLDRIQREETINQSSVAIWLNAWTDWLESDATLVFIQQHPDVWPTVEIAARHAIALYPNITVTPRQKATVITRFIDACENLQESVKSHIESPALLSPAIFVAAMESWLDVPTLSDAEKAFEELKKRLLNYHEKNRKNMVGIANEEKAREFHLALMKAYSLSGAYADVSQVFRLMSKDRVRWDTEGLVMLLEVAKASRQTHIVLHAWSIMRKTAMAKRARLVDFETWHFDLLLEALNGTLHGIGADYGVDVLRIVEELSKEEGSKVQLTANHYAKAAALMSRSSAPGMAEEILRLMDIMTKIHSLMPNEEMFGALVVSLGRSSSQKAAETAESMLQDLIARQAVDVRAYVAVMYAWMNSGHPRSVYHVEKTFTKLLTDSNDVLKPNRVAYRAMLEAWAREGRQKNAELVINLIDQFETQAANGELMEEAGDVALYTAAMSAVSKSKCFDHHLKVEALYDRLLKASADRPDNVELQPDSLAVTVLLQSWARSVDTHKARYVWVKWCELVDYYINGDLRMQPTPHAANAVLHACAYTTSDKGMKVRLEAVDISLKLWKDIQRFNLVNDFVIVSSLRVLGRHVEEYAERSRLASILFQHACVAGCVSERVVDALKKYVPTIFKQLPTNEAKSIELPAHWTRSVKSHTEAAESDASLGDV